MSSINCLLLVACVALLTIHAAPGKVMLLIIKQFSNKIKCKLFNNKLLFNYFNKGKPRGPKDPSANGHPHQDRPTLAPGETRPPHGEHDSNSLDGDHTHDPLHEKGTKAPGWNHPKERKPRDVHGGKRDRPTLPPGVTLPPKGPHGEHDSNSLDGDHTHDPLHEKETKAPGWNHPKERKPRDVHGGKRDRPTLPPGVTLPPRGPHGEDDSHDGDFTKEHRGEKPTLAPGQTPPPKRPPPPPPRGGKPGGRP